LGKLGNTTNRQIPDSRDLAREFSTFQASYHPVEGAGRNRIMPAGSFVAGWTQDSIVSCSDCHQNDAPSNGGKGPHGSSLMHILGGTSNYVTQEDPATDCGAGACGPVHNSGELCFKCHQYGTYAGNTNLGTTTNFRKGNENLHTFHDFTACYTCHDTHGSEQDRLINFNTEVVTTDPGYNSQSAWRFDYATNTGTCAVACHGLNHSSSETYSR